MIRKITIENFYSFGNPQSLDFSVAKNVPDSNSRYGTPIEGRYERFPRVIAVFGANASGKTNFLRSIQFLVDFIRNSASWAPEQPLPFLQFASLQWKDRPTRFLVEFDARVLEDHPGRTLYQYELEVAPMCREVVRECLQYYPEGHRRLLFERTGASVKAGKDFHFTKRDPVRDKIRENTSVISTLAQFNHPFALAMYHNLQAVQSNVMMVGDRIELSEDFATNFYLQSEESFVALKKEIRKFDLGIRDIKIISTNDGHRPLFFHSGLEGHLAFNFESHGTRRFYNIFPYLDSVLKYGGTAILDEFDNDIHPLILPEIIRKFQREKTNKKNAQLIISCHNTSIFEYLEKDEIYFTDKDNDGQTQIYGLHDIKNVRRESNLYAKYLAGVFGGVPRLG